jgi:PAS domain S-box-containing protein
VGSEQDYPPFATGMTDDTAGGFTVDLWKAVAAEAGLNYTIRVLPFHQILEEFKEGKINVLINLAISDERRQFADFTVPHVTVHGAIFVRKGESGIRSEEDLAGKAIIVLKANLAHDYAVSKGWGKQLVLVDTSEEGMRLLSSGKHDALLLGKLAGMLTLQATKLTNIKALKARAGFSQKFAFAVPKGQSELLSKLNEGLSFVKSKGRYDVLYEEWFGIYEVKEVGLRAVMKYIIPLVVIFLCFAGYVFYRRQVERKEAERQYRDLYDHTSDMFLSIETKSAAISDCNQALLNVTGYNREEIIGRSMYEMFHQDCAAQVGIAFHTFLTSKEVHGVELQLRCKNGSKIYVSMNASAVCDRKGVALQCRTVLRVISNR